MSQAPGSSGSSASQALFEAARKHYESGQFQNAASVCEQLLAQSPDHADGLHLVGILACGQGRATEAEPFIRRAIAASPGNAAYHNSLGNVLGEQGRFYEAIASFRRALELAPKFVDAMSNLGNALTNVIRIDEAIACIQQAVALNPNHVSAHSNLGNALREAGRLVEAITSYERALALNPNFADAHNNLGSVLLDLGRWDECVAHCRRAIELDPTSAGAQANLGVALFARLRVGEAVACYERAIALKPGLASAHLHLGMALLLRGDWRRGWRESEWRFEAHKHDSRRSPDTVPRWDGADLAGRRILLTAEQGLGDQLQFVRYASLVAARGGRVVIECDPPIKRLLENSPTFAGQTVIVSGELRPSCDVYCPLMSLPHLFDTTFEAIPRNVPYLQPNPADVAQWRDKIARHVPPGTLKVGVCWAGNKKHKNDRNRSIAPAALAPLAQVPNARFFSLQKGDNPLGVPSPTPPSLSIVDMTADFSDLAEAAAMIANLDLVITVDTAIAHLASAMGKPTWVLLPFVPDWRWLLDRDDSPWYPSASLFRQPAPGDWATVVARVAEALKSLAAAKSKVAGGHAHDARRFREACEHFNAQRLTQAAALCRTLMEVDADHAGSLHLLGLIELQSGRAGVGEGFLRRAVALEPANAEYQSHLGLMLAALDRNEEAVACFRRANELAPQYADAYVNLGTALVKLGRIDEAMASLERVIALNPAQIGPFLSLGHAMLEAGQIDEAIGVYRRGLEVDGTSAELHSYLGAAMVMSGRLDEAVEEGRRATAIAPGMSRAHLNLGAALFERGELARAIASYRQSIMLNPTYAHARHTLGVAMLLAGDFEHGWSEYESRLDVNPARTPRRAFPMPFWDGSPLAGRTIVLHAEQGLGDTIQFVRYARLVAERGGKVIIGCQEPLKRLLQNSPAFSQFPILARGETLPSFDLHCPLMSLPFLFGTKLETIPGGVPYLQASPDDTRRWSEKIAARSAPGVRKFGLVWAGSKKHKNDRNRSIAPAALTPLAQVTNAQFFSLQKGDNPLGATAPAGLVLVDMTADLSDLAEAAAMIANLDLVITVDTAIAHLAGAMGKPTWLLLSFVPDWRWLLDRDDSPWYPSVRLFRQPAPGDWATVIARVVEALNNKSNPSTSTNVSTAPALQSLFSEAFKHYQGGRFPQADAVCRQILVQDSGHANALHLLGILALQANRPDIGEDMIRRALTRSPDNSEFLSNLGNVLLARGRTEEAITCFQRAIAIKPDFTGACYNLAGAFNLVGRPHDAIAFYQRVVEQMPSHAGAHFHLAGTLHHVGRISESAASYRRATEVKPDYAEAWGNLGSVLYELDKKNVDEAIACCERTLALIPGHAHTHCNLGSMLFARGEFEEAIACFRKAIAFDPKNVDAHNNLGSALAKNKKQGEALECYQRAIALRPTHAEAYGNLGTVHMEELRFDDAIAAFSRAVELKPTLADAHMGLSLMLMEKQRWDEAAVCYTKALDLKPDSADMFNTLGNAMFDKGRHDEAETLLRKSLAIQPDFLHALVNLGNVLVAKGNLAEGETYFRRANELDPEYAAAHNNLGNLEKAKGRLDEAVARYRRSLELKPDFAQTHANLGVVKLMQGEFAEGWREYEWRWKVKNTPLLARKCPQPQWDGSDIAGKTILLHAEQGYGDTLQFIRYVTPVAARGARVVVEVPGSMQRLLKLSPLIAKHEIIAKGQPVPHFDVHCPLLSVPLAMDTNFETIPGEVPYLKADDADIAAWSALLAADTAALKVGIVWAGNKLHQNDRNRSLPLAALSPLFEAGGESVSFYSLQKGEKSADAKTPPAGTRLLLPPCELGDFADTAALMANLDLIISVDTAVVHLAGGLGRPTWILLPFDPDWRWLLGRADSPWYPTMRLFRQPTHRDWASAIAEVAAALRALRNGK